LAANGMTASADAASVGASNVINHPVNVADLPRRAIGAAPAFGQHSDEILGQLGYTPTDIAALRSDGVV
jgi:crotonobetainyl-CoA:carnitine CoA-transferase CaiB-like acyl-CoA transferase